MLFFLIDIDDCKQVKDLLKSLRTPSSFLVGSSLTYGTHWMIYEYFKRHLTPMVHGNESLIPFVYMASASMGKKCFRMLIV